MPPATDDEFEIPGDIPPFKLAVVLLYVILLMVGGFWIWIGGHRLFVGKPAGERTRECLIAAAAGVAVVGVVEWMARRTRWLDAVEDGLAAKLGRLDRGEILAISGLAALAEEVFFRGAFQPAVHRLLDHGGAALAVTSLVFGLLHTGPTRASWPWTLFATLAGVLLGWSALATGDIVAPAILHFVITSLNMRRIVGKTRAAAP